MKGMESWTRFSCHGRMPPAALARSVSRKCRTIPFFGRFLESCYIAHPRTRAKVPEKPVSFLRDDPLDLSPKKTAPLNYLI